MTCHICNSNDVVAHFYDRSYICRYCINKHDYMKCHNCDRYHPEEYMLDDCYCYNCRKPEDVHYYNHKPEPIFKGSGKYFFGIELECMFMEPLPYKKYFDATKKLQERLPDCYLKRDSSINRIGKYRGVEIVSHPMANTCINSLLKKLSKIHELGFDCPIELEDGNRVSCGMHVHIGKKHLTNKQILNVCLFVLRNQEFIKFISQRTRHSFNRWCGEDMSLSQIQHRVKHDISLGRERMSNREDTIEIRIFKASTDLRFLKKNIEFVQAIIDYSKESCYENNPDKFKKFVFEYRNKYKNLNSFITCGG